MNKEKIKTWVIKDISNFINANREWECGEVSAIIDFLETLDGYSQEADQLYIKNLDQFIYVISGYEDIKPHWVHQAKPIFEGKYPLEKLPEHVRELAKELYYGTNK